MSFYLYRQLILSDAMNLTAASPISPEHSLPPDTGAQSQGHATPPKRPVPPPPGPLPKCAACGHHESFSFQTEPTNHLRLSCAVFGGGSAPVSEPAPELPAASNSAVLREGLLTWLLIASAQGAAVPRSGGSITAKPLRDMIKDSLREPMKGQAQTQLVFKFVHLVLG